MPKPKKIGKDVFDKKATEILRTARERAAYEEWKAQKLAQNQEKEEEEKKKKTIGSERMPEEREKEEAEAPFTRLPLIKGKLKVKKVVLKEEEK